MPIDFRVDCEYPNHPKTRRLIRRAGDGAAFRLVGLWGWTRANRPDGVLTGLTDEDVEDAVGWRGQPGEFVAALLAPLVEGAHGFLERLENGTLKCHDWEEHQPFAMADADRRENARTAGIASGEARRAKAEARRTNTTQERDKRSKQRTLNETNEAFDSVRADPPETPSEPPLAHHEKARNKAVSEKSAERRTLNDLPENTPKKGGTTPFERNANGTRTPTNQPTNQPAREDTPVVDREHRARGSDGRASRPPDSDDPPDRDLDPSDAARAEGQRWKLFVADQHPNLTEAITPLRCVGKYRRSGKHVFDVDTREERDAAKTALQQAGGPELAAAVVIRIRPRKVFGSSRERRGDANTLRLLERLQGGLDQETP